VAVLGDVAACIGALAADLGSAQGAGKSATATIATLTTAMTAMNAVINGLGKVI
jgi:hypothetical protein